MGLFDVNIWLLFIPAALIALFSLFPAQYFVQQLRLVSYNTPRFFLKMKEDKAFQRNLMKYRNVNMLMLSFVVVAAFYITYVIFADTTTSYVSIAFLNVVISDVIVSLFIMLFKYRKWRLSGIIEPARMCAKDMRLNISLAFVLVFLQFTVYMVIVLIAMIFKHFLSASGMLDSRIVVSYCLGMLLIVYGANWNIACIPRLLALASILLQPIETFIEKKKNTDASGHGMV